MGDLFTDQLKRCQCCPRYCRVNRLAGRTGICSIGADIPISHIGLHHGEEPPISGAQGSGTVFFAGCNLACVFCQNHQISQGFRHNPTRALTIDELADEILCLQEQGAHNINFVSPSHMILQMAEAITAAREKGLTIPVVYNSNGYDSVDTLRQIRGLVDIYLPDIKYMDNTLAEKYSGVRDYADIVPAVLNEMLAQVGHLEVNEAGLAERGLLVRHLVLPGFPDNSRRCLDFLASLSRETTVSIMSQYSPQYRAADYPEINRGLTTEEYTGIIDHALDLGLVNVFVQELESRHHYLPDFTLEKPFTPTSSTPDR